MILYFFHLCFNTIKVSICIYLFQDVFNLFNSCPEWSGMHKILVGGEKEPLETKKFVVLPLSQVEARHARHLEIKVKHW